MNNLTFRQLANMKLHIFIKLALLVFFCFSLIETALAVLLMRTAYCLWRQFSDLKPCKSSEYLYLFPYFSFISIFHYSDFFSDYSSIKIKFIGWISPEIPPGEAVAELSCECLKSPGCYGDIWPR